MDKEKVAEILVEIGTLLELKGENPFKTRAYANGARTIEGLSEPLAKLVAEKRLGEIKGIGEALEQKITELVETGRLKYYEDLKASIAPGLIEMLEISGLGPKKIQAMNKKLGIDSIAKLEAACQAGKVAELDGFGEKTQANILEGIAMKRNYASKHRLADALTAAEPLLEKLRAHEDVIRCDTAGSLRRFKEVIGDIDLLASSKEPVEVINFFAAQPGIAKVLAKGETKTSVILDGGIQCDLRVVSDAEFPFALAYFTGSKEHNIVMRQRAIQRGLRLNEYGLFKSKEETRDPKLLVACKTEEDIFQKLDLAYVPPELREDHGEFSAAEKNALPKLIEWTQLKGALHNHSNWSDGKNTLEEIATYMEDLGLEYWAITDHSKASYQANGLDPARLQKQIAEIKELNAKIAARGGTFRLLTGSEVDILKDRLDFDDDVLAELDVVVASLHVPSSGEAENTKRLIRAAENPHVHMLGHMTGRLLLEREPYPVNVTAVIDACAATGTWLELNCNPWRFDLDWRHWPYAKSKGVKCVINPDSHRNIHAGFLRLGAGMARKGWLEPKDVLNTLNLKSLQKQLNQKRAGKVT
ncbi:MAG TPA: DNA polymerase/3'-5' exonuclease PolX [Candidatus Acidoferrales bacterium]|jgi:DNA polymerase (family 10)|nr:DNA polymerase/3'-5' exonuclease PolX [Candidatus Acidoferrales bacterium]